jgi:hypothetical protein
MDIEAVVEGADRRHVVAPGLGEILQRMQPALRAQAGDDVLCDRSGIEPVAPAARDHAQRRRQLGLDVQVAWFRRGAVLQEDGGRRRVFLQPRRGCSPIEGDAVMHDIALFRIADRRRKRRIDSLAAVIREQPAPGIDRAGYRDRVGAIGRNGFEASFAVPSGRGRCGRSARAVERHHVALASRAIEHETIAADSGGLRLDDRLHCRRADGGIHRVAAGAQHLQRGKGRQRVGGCHHRVGRADR